jgi:predicted dehydrogenase
MVGHNTRRELRYRYVRGLITSGKLGKIVAGNMIFSSPAGLLQPADSWRMSPERCIALVVSQLGVHLFDTFNYIFGCPDEIQASIRSIAIANGLHDLCSGTMGYQSGACANFTICYSTARRRALEVLGTKGSIYTDESNTFFRSVKVSVAPRMTSFPAHDSVQEEFEEFVRCCRTGVQPETNGLAGLHAVAVMETVLASDLAQKRLKFDWNCLEKSSVNRRRVQRNDLAPDSQK